MNKPIVIFLSLIRFALGICCDANCLHSANVCSVHIYAYLTVVAMTLENYSSGSMSSVWKHAETFAD